MRFLRHSLTGLLLLAITLALLIFAGALVRDALVERMNREPRVPQQRERVFTVTVERAEPATIAPVLTAFGEVASRRTLDLRAASSGKVIELSENFQEGGQVNKGDVLLRIDPVDARASLDRTETDLSDALAEQREAARALDLAQDELDAAQEQAELRARAAQRQKDLVKRGVGTTTASETAELAASAAQQAVLTRRQALSQAQARVDQAQSRVTRATIARDEAQRRLDDTVLRAAFDGTLAGVSLVAGGLVTQNERLAQLVDGHALEVALRISTQQYARLLDDSGELAPLPVTITLSVLGADLTANGHLSRDSAAVGAGQTGRLIFARIDTARGFKPGDFVTVSVAEPALENVIRLPARAMSADGTVLVLGADDRLEMIPVTLLRRQGDDILVRGQGLAGREVVRERSPLLGTGIKVKPLRDLETGAGIDPAEPEMLDLSEDRRAKLVAFVEGNTRMPEALKSSILEKLQKAKVPAQMVQSIEARIGG